MNFSNSTTDKTERLKDQNTLAVQWESFGWAKVEKEVNRLQTRIAKATVKGDKNKIKRGLNIGFYQNGPSCCQLPERSGFYWYQTQRQVAGLSCVIHRKTFFTNCRRNRLTALAWGYFNVLRNIVKNVEYAAV